MEQENYDEYTHNLMDKALNGEHTNFELICSLEEYRIARVLYITLKKLAKSFKKAAQSLRKDYLDDIKNNRVDNKDSLLAVMQLEQCAGYFKLEELITKDMLKEFRIYMNSGHLINMLTGCERPEEDKVDYRTLPISFF